MNILRMIDGFFFGTLEEQEGANKREKLYFYIPGTFIIAMFLFIKIHAGF